MKNLKAFSSGAFEFLEGEASKSNHCLKVYDFLATQGSPQWWNRRSWGRRWQYLAVCCLDLYARFPLFRSRLSLTAQVDFTLSMVRLESTQPMPKTWWTFARSGWSVRDPEVLSTLGHREWSGMGEMYCGLLKIRNFGKVEDMDGSIRKYSRACKSIISSFTNLKRPCGGRRAGRWHSSISIWSYIWPCHWSCCSYMGRLCMEKPSVRAWCSSPRVAEEKKTIKGITQKIEKCAIGLPRGYEQWDQARYQAWPMTKKPVDSLEIGGGVPRG